MSKNAIFLGRRGFSGNHDAAFHILPRRASRRKRPPALGRFANSSPISFLNGVKADHAEIVTGTDEDRNEFLLKRGFLWSETAKIIDSVLTEEGHAPASAFDFVLGIRRWRARGRTKTRVETWKRVRSSASVEAGARLFSSRARRVRAIEVDSVVWAK